MIGKAGAAGVKVFAESNSNDYVCLCGIARVLRFAVKDQSHAETGVGNDGHGLGSG